MASRKKVIRMINKMDRKLERLINQNEKINIDDEKVKVESIKEQDTDEKIVINKALTKYEFISKEYLLKVNKEFHDKTKILKIVYCIILIFLALVCLRSTLQIQNETMLLISKYSIDTILVKFIYVYLTYIIIILLFKFIAFYLSRGYEFWYINGYKVILKIIRSVFNSKMMILKFIILPDFVLANTFKLGIAEDIQQLYTYDTKKASALLIEVKDRWKTENTELPLCILDVSKMARKFFVLYSNWLNVILSLALGTICWRLMYLNHEMAIFFFGIIILRIWSRVIEIICAFYNDFIKNTHKIISIQSINKKIFIDNYKNSSLKKKDRISLIVHTIIEIIIIFTFLSNVNILGDMCKKDIIEYYSKDNRDNKKYEVKELNKENGLTFIFDETSIITSFPYTLSVSLFNYSFSKEFSLFEALKHVIQVFTTSILILFCLAGYLSINDRDNKLYLREEDFLLSYNEFISRIHN